MNVLLYRIIKLSQKGINNNSKDIKLVKVFTLRFGCIKRECVIISGKQFEFGYGNDQRIQYLGISRERNV